MPRVLNVERLEIKFASLTRSRDSITNLSSWILDHSEFCNDIAEEWLAGLHKNFVALNMLYVANDVIMNCGKRRVPQYRTAFANVLETAMGLNSVKGIAKEVMRMIDIWKTRGIYEEVFCDTLKDKLNNKEPEKPKNEAVEQPASDEAEEESEACIIEKYKKENLFDKLDKFRYIADEVKEKEEILMYAEEPERPDFELLGHKETHQMITKIERYCEALKRVIRLKENEIHARKDLLKELKNTNIFYTSQNEDVKTVAQMYKVYGKKLKNVAKRLSEKKETLPPPARNSPFYDHDTSSPKSPNDDFSGIYDYFSPSNDTINSDENSNSISNDENVDSNLTSGESFFNNFPADVAETSKSKISPTNLEMSTSNIVEEDKVASSTDFENSNSFNANNESINNCYLIPLEKIQEIDCKSTDISSSNKKLESSPTEQIVLSPIPSTDEKTKHSKSSNQTINCISPEKLSNVCSKISVRNTEESISGHQESMKENSSLDCMPSADSISSPKKPASLDTIPLTNVQKPEPINEMDVDELEQIDHMLEKTLKRESIKRKIELLLTKNKKQCQNLEQQKVEIIPSEIKSQTKSLEILKCTSSEITNQEHIVDIFEKTLSQPKSKTNDNEFFKNTSSNIKIQANKDEILKTPSKMKSPANTNENSEKNVSDIESQAISNNNFDFKLDDKQKVNNLNKDALENISISQYKSEDNEQNLNEYFINNKPGENLITTERQTTINTTTFESNVSSCPNSDIKILTSNTFLSLSTAILKDILEKSTVAVLGKSKDDVKSLNQKCDNMKENVPSIDSFFSSLIDTKKEGNYHGIPGLEIAPDNRSEYNSTNDIIEENKKVGVNDHSAEETSSNTNNDKEKETTVTCTYINDSCLSSKDVKEIPTLNIETSEIKTPENKHTQYDTDLEKHKEMLDFNSVDNLSNINYVSEEISRNSKDTVVNKVSETKINKAPNIIQNLGNVLKYICNYKTSKVQLSNKDFKRNLSSNLHPCMSLENCLKLYSALQYKTCEIVLTNTSALNKFTEPHQSNTDFCTTTNVLQGPILSTFDSNMLHNSKISTKSKSTFTPIDQNKDNLEVADMECDSE